MRGESAAVRYGGESLSHAGAGGTAHRGRARHAWWQSADNRGK